MDTRFFNNKMKILSILIIICFASFCFIISNKHVIINDTAIPISHGNIEAMFYIENHESGTVTCIGDGLINTNSEIYDNSEEVEMAIITAPDYSNYISSELTISWDSIKIRDGQHNVYGSIAPIRVSKSFNTVYELKTAALTSGSFVSTKGYYAKNDGGAAEYQINTNADQDALDNIKLDNGMYASLQALGGIKNVKQVGTVGNGITDDSDAIITAVTNNKNVYFPSGTYKINDQCASFLTDKSLNGDGVIKFANWSKQWVAGTSSNVFDGTCEISRMNDPVYMAAHWPSEAKMTEDSRNNICVSTNLKLNDSIRKICYHGAVVRVKDKEIPDTFTICLGKGQLYAYKNNQWVLLNESLPSFALYDASWKNPAMNVPKNNIKRYDDHIEITLTKDMWYPNNDEMLLHYYCQSYELSQNENASDYKYYFATYSAWAKDSTYDDCFCFGVSADMRDRQNKIYELGIGKMYLLKATPRIAYFYNVPDSEYDTLIKPFFK